MSSITVPDLGRHLRGALSTTDLFVQATGYDLDETPWLPPYLEEVLNIVLLKGRQVGASTGSGVKLIRRARYVPWSMCLIISPSLKQSTEVKDRAKASLIRLGDHLVKDSASEISLRNHSRIVSLPGSAKSARGWTADDLVIDEAAFLDQETFLAARATVATGGRTIIQSTPVGPYGDFYDTWMSEEAGLAHYKVKSEDVRTIDPAFLAKERETMSEEEYLQEYGAEFTTPGLGLIDPERLRELTQAEQPEDESPWGRLGGSV